MPRHRLALLVATAVVAVSCASSPPSPPSSAATTAAPIEPPSAEAVAGDEALAAYSAYWTVITQARSAPGSKDWDPELEAVATGQALATVRADVANYADLPAHTEGMLSRAPMVENATTGRVAILDCVDLGDVRLVADDSGKVLDDLVNRVQRYRFRAEVLADGGGSWRVDHTAPALEEPC